MDQDEKCLGTKYDYQCGLGLTCMQGEHEFRVPSLRDGFTLAKTVKIKVGYCKPYVKEGEECQIRDQDGRLRTYLCGPGLKCTKKTSNDSRRICYQMYYLEDGEDSDDPDLCQGGWIYPLPESSGRKRCVSINAIKMKDTSDSQILKFPYRCDM